MQEGTTRERPRPRRDSGAGRALFRAVKLLLRGDPLKARGVLDEAYVAWRVPPAPLPSLAQVAAQFAPPTEPAGPVEPVDVIVPVHNGPQHVARLFATLFDRTGPQHRFLLADDASTDQQTLSLLQAASARPNVRLLRSETNRGFTATVNAAMAEATGHAVLLNTDTEVPPGWLDRLMRPIRSERRIASATPFSNSASIFSFPVPDRVNALPAGLDVCAVDAAFARLTPAFDPSLVAPAGVGFCMAVHIGAWRALGPFDAATFGRGYGEETDWCLRAAAAGWRNLLVPNLFVYHEDGGTFGTATKRAILQINLRHLHRRWPAYRRQLATFCRRDPFAPRRAAAMLALATAPHGQAGTMVRASPANDRGETVVEIEVDHGHCAIGPIADADPAGRVIALGRSAWR